MTIYEIGTGTRLLDVVLDQLHCSDTRWDAMEMLFSGLAEIRHTAEPEEWQRFIAETCVNHPLCQALYQEPITFRSATKPRGYAGDALLLDLIYQEPSAASLLKESSDLGKDLYKYMIQAPAARAVRLRRDLIAGTIDEVANEVSAAEVLSLACGHLREIHLSEAFEQGRVQRIVGLDHDKETIAYGTEQLAPLGVQLVHGNALHLLKGRFELGTFDFIYASGLFDYLSQSLAQKLAEVMFGMLKPGGRMLIINAVPGMRDTGYMDSFMDWRLIYRDLDELIDIAAALPRDEIAERDVFMEDNQNWAFLQIRKQ
jgi:extracellular factor (EF) 3-hydroxypalmitic acid methyl ester biosynthesis protein